MISLNGNKIPCFKADKCAGFLHESTKASWKVVISAFFVILD
jgi:hypothetical protein